MKQMFIILSQIGNRVEPAWWDDDRPVLFETVESAQGSLLDDFEAEVSRQVQEFRDGEREFDEVDTQLTDWIEECTLHEDGRISLKDNPNFYDPATWVR